MGNQLYMYRENLISGPFLLQLLTSIFGIKIMCVGRYTEQHLFYEFFFTENGLVYDNREK